MIKTSRKIELQKCTQLVKTKEEKNGDYTVSNISWTSLGPLLKHTPLVILVDQAPLLHPFESQSLTSIRIGLLRAIF